MHKFGWLLASVLFLPVYAAALALPEQVQKDYPHLRLAGEGRLLWFGLHIYDASLWTRGRNFGPDAEFALDIRYARDVNSRRLIQSSIEEMRRLGLGDERSLDAWSRQMTNVFPDVKKGDRLTGVNRPGLGAEFYHRGKRAGLIADPAFSRAFFAIWLDARTREPGLRRSLTGIK